MIRVKVTKGHTKTNDDGTQIQFAKPGIYPLPDELAKELIALGVAESLEKKPLKKSAKIQTKQLTPEAK